MSKIEFYINGKKCILDCNIPRETTLNEYIRYAVGKPGTKSMCLEGGCGACIVMVRAKRYPSGNIETFSVNSCLVLVWSCCGWEVTTVEGLGDRERGYSAVQRRLTAFNGTQCGYCSPGWVMHMTSLLDKRLTMSELEKSFGSNTCRCTGFRPILDTMKSFATDASPELRHRVTDIEELHLCKKTNKKCFQQSTSSGDFEKCLEQYVKIDNVICIDFGYVKFYKVFEENDIFTIWRKEGLDSYMLVDGNTAKGVYESFDYPRALIDISGVQCLKEYRLDQNLILGGNVSLEDCIEIFKDLGGNSEFAYLNEFVKHFEMIAHIPVRKIGSLAGNLMLKHANPFYQSDVFVLFEAVGAAITIQNANGQRLIMSLLDFLSYNMRGNLISCIALPPYSESHVFRSYKIMPRNQNATAIVNAAFLLKIDNSTSTVEEARLVFGNISPTFNHAVNTERYLIGKRVFDNDILRAAMRLLNDELIVIEKLPFASTESRKTLALGLFYKGILSLAPPGLVSSLYLSGGTVLERPISKGTQDYQSDPSLYPLNQPVKKLEGQIQSSGEAQYANDVPHSIRDVFGAFVLSTVATGQVDSIDIDELQKINGVLALYTSKDIPGINSFAVPGFDFLVEEEEILATNIKYHGQPIAIVVATTQQLALDIARKVNVKYKNVANTPPVLTINEAKKYSERYIPSKHKIVPSGRGTDVTHVIKGVYEAGAQYHYHMEPFTCIVVPVDGKFEVYDSTQWMIMTQTVIARCLGRKTSDILVQVRRLGGSFGAKTTKHTIVAAACAIVANNMNRPCRFILPIHTNLNIAGRRFPCQCEYEVGINKEGKIQYLNATFIENFGCSVNDSLLDFVMNFLGHCYDTKYWRVDGAMCITDLPSNTYCRAAARSEAIPAVEHIMEHIAHTVNKDPIQVREINMIAEDNDLPTMIQEHKDRTDYDNRATNIDIFNKNNRWKKKAINISIMSYPVVYLGNYSAQVTIYRGDGTVTVTSGGIEMGQGLNTKAAQVCAYELGIPLEIITVISSYSFTAPNNIFTASSITSECVCYSIIKACKVLKERLAPIRARMPDANWRDIVKTAGDEQINLTANYMMTDKEEDLKPYNSFAVTIMEVELDVLTGRFQIDRVDILEDVGLSANPDIDVGQVEGGFIFGLGYFTSEKLVYDRSTGKLMTNRSFNYHVPLANDIPVNFNVRLRYNSKNPKGVLGSKAVGEMGVVTALGINHALRRCIMESRRHSGYNINEWIHIPVPYDTDTILKALNVKSEEFVVKKCLVLVWSCSGWEVTTVEGLGDGYSGYSVVQRRLAAFNGTQCGYCSPGWVMHMTSLLNKNLTMSELEKSFGSNTCRCTGFRPILDTMKSFATDASPELRQRVTDIEELYICKKTGKECFGKCTSNEDLDKCLREYIKINNMIFIDFGKVKFYKVFEENDIFNVWKKEGTDSYMLVDGNTAKGIYESFDYPRVLIDISDVQSLKEYKSDQNLILGGNVSLEDCIGIFKHFGENSEFAYLNEFVKHFEVIAHIPVRKIGSLAGNLMIKHVNHFYQSDVFVLFEAVGAAITIRNANGQSKVMSLLDFLSYNMLGNLITCIALPPYSRSHVLRSYKCILSVAPPGLVSNSYISGGTMLERPVSKGTQDFQSDPSLYPLNQPVEKLEGQIQTSGEARFANDAPSSIQDVFGAFVLSTVATGQVDSIDVDELQKINGFLALYTSKDVPGVNSFAVPGFDFVTDEEEILATNIKYHGQPIAIAVATTQQQALDIARKVKVKYINVANTPPVLTINEAKKDSKRFIPSPFKVVPSGRGTDVTKVIKGVYEAEAQYHYYMEPLTCVVVPVDGRFEVYDASQWMAFSQTVVARCLGRKVSDIVVKVTRLGGGFGGKISKNTKVTAACAIVANNMNRPCRFILPIHTNLKIAGRRFPCQCEYEVGLNDEGKIQYLNATHLEDFGCSTNDSLLEYVVQYYRHCYESQYFGVDAAICITDLPSNTYCRAAGSAEALCSIEHIMEHIAQAVNKDPIEVRKLNMTTEDNDLPTLIRQHKERTDYDKRAKAIEIFNKNNRWKKRAINVSVMRYPIIYYGNFSAQVSIYRGDGTVTVTSGGIEIGQGLNTKAAQICAYELGIPLENITVISSYTFTAPNNIYTATSTTSEAVCYSIIKACEVLKERLAPIRARMPDATWKDIVKKAGDELINLTANYMMNDKEEDLKPYNVYGVTVMEVELDVLTGRFQIDRVDILEDVGLSANPNIDVGQVEGGFIFGLGYYTCEKFVYDSSIGELKTNRSLTYHVPLANDIPVDFNVRLRYNSKNTTGVLGSKGVGELGVVTALGINHALRRCIMESRRDSGYDMNEWIHIPVPYDTETIIKALDVKPEEFVVTK